MIYKFRMTTQSYRKGDVAPLPNDPNTQSLLRRGIIEPFQIETKPMPAFETKPDAPVAVKKRGRKPKVKPDA
jgi:hypothetical protein